MSGKYPIPIPTFVSNFSAVFLDKIHNLTYSLEAALPHQRPELILEWTKEAQDLIKYAESVLKFCRGQGAIYQKLVNLINQENAISGFYSGDLQNILGALNAFAYPFPSQPLRFEDSMKILSDKTYNQLPTTIYRMWQYGSAASKETTEFHIKQRYENFKNRDTIIQEVNKIIRQKIQFVTDFPIKVNQIMYFLIFCKNKELKMQY